MIDEKKIEKAAKQRVNAFRKANPDGYSTIIVDIESDCMDNFKAGANWALQEFWKSLWHDASERPERERPILLKYGDFFSAQMFFRNEKWSEFTSCFDIDSWCYVDDLFPKEGGEQ